MNFTVFERSHRFTSILVLFALILLVGVGCTKKDNSSKVTVDADWSALTKSHAKMRAEQQSSGAGAFSNVTVVSRVMINVSAPDMANSIVFIWDLKSTGYQGGNAAVPTPPSSFQLEVPRGANRLIQVLAIVEEMNSAGGGDGGPMSFYYGDQTKSIASAEESAELTLARQSIATNGQGSISGRYFNADGSTPSGTVNMYYSPAGKPRMIVEKTTIFSGYFQFFMLPGVPFSYRLDGGDWLMENVLPSNLTSLHSARVLSVHVPPGFREEGISRYQQEQRVKFIGFFGPGAGLSARQVCFRNVPGSVANLFTSATPGDSALVPWQPFSASATVARTGGGGVGTSGGACANGTFGLDQFGISLDNLAYGDSPLGIRGPFVDFTPAAQTYTTSIAGTHSGSNLTLTWKYLNGVVGNSVDGVAIFTRVIPASESMPDWHDSAPCSELVSRHGFVESARIASGSSLAPIETVVISGVPAAAYMSGRHVSVVCPYKNNRLYDFAISHYKNSGNGPGEPAAVKILALPATSATETTAAQRYPVVQDTCTAIRLVTVDASGNHARRQGGGNNVINVSVVGAPANVKLYRDTDCTDPAGGDSTIDVQINSGPEKWFSVKSDSVINEYDIVAVDASVNGAPITSGSFYANRLSSAPPTHVHTELPAVLHAHQCYPLHYVRGRTFLTYFVSEVGGGGSISHAIDPGNYQTYFDDACTSATAGSAPFSGTMSWARSYIKFTSPGSFTITPEVSGLSGGLTAFAKTVTVLAAPVATHFRIEGLASMISNGDCHEANIVGYNGSMRAIVPAGVTFAPTFTTSTASANNSPTVQDYGFHNGGSCSTTLIAPTIAVGGVEAPVRFKWAFDPNGTILDIRLNPPATYTHQMQTYTLFNP